MADVQRTRAQILALFADNATGAISAQDLRDFVVTLMESEFVNPGDFWAKPEAKYITTDKTAKGFIMYSQLIEEACSFGNILFMTKSNGGWSLANVATSTTMGFLGLAMDSYAALVSTAQILIEGIVYNSVYSTLFSRLIGRPIYLGSTGSAGSITMTITTNSNMVIGIPLGSDFTNSATGKFYFKPDTWAIRGV